MGSSSVVPPLPDGFVIDAQPPDFSHMDARSGELGRFDNSDGSNSTEISITVTDPRLNGGRPTNIPTLVQGQVDLDALRNSRNVTDQQQEIAISRAIERVKIGERLPSFNTIEEAVSAAQDRSAYKSELIDNTPPPPPGFMLDVPDSSASPTPPPGFAIDSNGVPATMDDLRQQEVDRFDEQGGGFMTGLKTGAHRAKQTLAAAAVLLGDALIDDEGPFDTSSVGKWLHSQTARDRAEVLDHQRAIEKLPQHPSMRHMVDAGNKAEDWQGALAAFGDEFWNSPDKLGLVINQTGEQVPNFITFAVGTKGASNLLGVGSGAMQTAKTMAALGAGSGAASAASTFGPNVAEGLVAGLTYDDAEAKAAKKSLAQAVVDGATGAVLPLKFGPNQWVNVPVQAVIQMLGGGFGDAAGKVAVDEPVGKGDFLAESLMELLGLPVELTQAAVTKATVANARSGNELDSLVENTKDLPPMQEDVPQPPEGFVVDQPLGNSEEFDLGNGAAETNPVREDNQIQPVAAEKKPVPAYAAAGVESPGGVFDKSTGEIVPEGQQQKVNFAYAGRKAETADQSRLARAVEMDQQGVDAEAIRNETGWFKGYDDQWRFEVDDSGATYKPEWSILNQRFADITNAKTQDEKRTALDSYRTAFGVSFNEDGKSLAVPLASVIDHESLFNSYPELKHVRVRFDKNTDGGSFEKSGEHDPGVITLGIDSITNQEEAKSVLLHEIQHAIQEIEGFASGGTPKQFLPVTDKRIQEAENYVTELEHEYQENNDPDWLEFISSAKNDVDRLKRHRGLDKVGQYDRLAGEIEARDVQARKDFTPEERQSSKPMESQGIPKEDAIVIYRSQKANSEGKRASVDEVRQWAAPVRLSFGQNAPQVNVVKSVSELPPHIRKQAGDGGAVAGVHDMNNVYLVADNINSRQEALTYLAHETVGHYAIESMMDEKTLGDLLDKVQWLKDAGNKKVLAIAEEVRSRYVDLDPMQESKEIIAVMAEKRQFGSVLGDFAKKVYAAIRKFLKKLGFPSLKFSNAELEALLVDAGRFLRRDTGKVDSAVDVLHHKELGNIDLEHGKDGRYGASEIVARYPDIGQNIEALVAGAEVVHRDGEAAILKNGNTTFKLIKRDGRWVMTGAERGGSARKVANMAFKSRGDIPRVDKVPEYSDRADLIKQVSAIAKDRFVGKKFVNQDTGDVIHVANSGIKKTIGHKARGGHPNDHQLSILALDKIIEQATYKGVEQDNQGRANIKAVHKYDSMVDVQGRVYDVELVVREGFDGKRFYSHVLIKHEPSSPGIMAHGERAAPADTEASTTESIDKINFARKARTPEGSSEALNDVEKMAEKARKSRGGIGDLIEDWRPAWLGALTRHHLVDIGRRYLPQSLPRYETMAREMDAFRNTKVSESAELANKWHAFNRKVGKAVADRTAAVMHDATIAGADPAEAYSPLWTRDEAKAEIEKLQEQAKGRSGEGTARIMEEIKIIRGQLKNEPNRKAEHAKLQARYDKLPQEAKDLYREVREQYQKQIKAYFDAIIEKIQRDKANDKAKRLAITNMKRKFERTLKEGPYFPLGRHGDYWVNVKGGDNPGFFMFEKSGQQKAFMRELAKDGIEYSHGKKLENIKAVDGASMGFVADVMETINEVGGENSVSEKVQDAIYQLYLTHLPDLSMRKQFIHRKKTPGFSNDALRSYAKNVFHANYQLAKLKYADQLQDTLEMMKAEVRESSHPERAADLYREMGKRHEWMMNPQSGALASKLTGLGFTWFLGLSPAAAIVNVTQTPFVAMPIMASNYSWGAASKHLTKASKDYFAGKFDIENTLKGDELKAYREFVDSGLIDKTLTHDLVGLSETDSAIYNPMRAKSMAVIAGMFHHAEKFNREITSMATYRMAREAGKSHEVAVRQAIDLTWESHFDYANANKARFMQNDTAKVVLMFRQFSLNMTYLLARNFQQAMKGETKAARKMARQKLVGIMGMHSLAVGAMGMPIWTMVSMVANALFDDPDDDFDFDTEFRNFMAEEFGIEGSHAISKGPIEATTDIGIADRVNIDIVKLWFRPPDRDEEGKALVLNVMEQIFGPIGGIFTGFGKAYDRIKDGNIERGIEAAVPKFIRDPLKAYRYNQEGVNTMDGRQVVDTDGWQEFLQGIGFSVGEVNRQYDRNNAAKKAEMSIKHRRSNLMNRFALARRLGDKEMLDQTKADIKAFNSKNPRNQIRPIDVNRSIRQRARVAAQSEGGLYQTKKYRHTGEGVGF